MSVTSSKGKKQTKKRKKPSELKALEKRILHNAVLGEPTPELPPKLELKIILEMGYENKQQLELIQKRMLILEKRSQDLQALLPPSSKLRAQIFGEKPALRKHDETRPETEEGYAQSLIQSVTTKDTGTDGTQLTDGRESGGGGEANHCNENDHQTSDGQEREKEKGKGKGKKARKRSSSKPKRRSRALTVDDERGETVMADGQEATGIDAIDLSQPTTTPSPSVTPFTITLSPTSGTTRPRGISPRLSSPPPSPSQVGVVANDNSTPPTSPSATTTPTPTTPTTKPPSPHARLLPHTVTGTAMPPSPPMRKSPSPRPPEAVAAGGGPWSTSSLSPSVKTKKKKSDHRATPGTKRRSSVQHLSAKEDSSAISKIKKRIFSSKHDSSPTDPASELKKRPTRSTSTTVMLAGGPATKSSMLRAAGRRGTVDGTSRRSASPLQKPRNTSWKNMLRNKSEIGGVAAIVDIPATQNGGAATIIGGRERKLSFADDGAVQLMKQRARGKGRTSDSDTTTLSESDDVSDPASENDGINTTNTDDWSVSFDDHTESETDANIDAVSVVIDMIEGRHLMMRDSSFDGGLFYCIFTLGDTELPTPCVKGGQDPQWTETTTTLLSYEAEEVLYISVWLKAPEGSKEGDLFLGCTEMPLIFVASCEPDFDCWLFLEGRSEKEEGPFGAIKLRIRFKEAWEDMAEEEELKELLWMIMNEKGDLAILESLINNTCVDNNDLREEIAQAADSGREKIKFLEERLEGMNPQRVAQASLHQKESLELQKKELMLYQAYSKVFRNNPREKQKFDEHVKKVLQNMRRVSMHRLSVPGPSVVSAAVPAAAPLVSGEQERRKGDSDNSNEDDEIQPATLKVV